MTPKTTQVAKKARKSILALVFNNLTDWFNRRRLRNEMGSKFLDEVIEQTGMDYDEAIETIEREKKARYVTHEQPISH